MCSPLLCAGAPPVCPCPWSLVCVCAVTHSIPAPPNLPTGAVAAIVSSWTTISLSLIKVCLQPPARWAVEIPRLYVPGPNLQPPPPLPLQPSGPVVHFPHQWCVVCEPPQNSTIFGEDFEHGSMPALAWEGEAALVSGGTAVPLPPSNKNIPWLLGFAERSPHLSHFLNPPTQFFEQPTHLSRSGGFRPQIAHTPLWHTPHNQTGMSHQPHQDPRLPLPNLIVAPGCPLCAPPLGVSGHTEQQGAWRMGS